MKAYDMKGPGDLEPEFFSWAFSERDDFKEEIELMDEWNKLHGDLYKAKPDNNMWDDLQIMHKHYKDYKDKKTNQGI